MTRDALILAGIAAAVALGCGEEQNNDGGQSSTGGKGGSSNGSGGGSMGGGTGGQSGGGSGGSATAGTGGSSTGGTGGTVDPCPGGAMCNGTCLQLGESGGNCTLFAQPGSQILDLAFDADYIYLGLGSGVARVPKAGGIPETVIETQDSVPAVAVNGSAVFYSESGFSSSTLSSMPKAGGMPTELDTNSDDIEPILANETRVFYFKTHFGGAAEVTSRLTGGGGALTYGGSDSSFDALAVDGTHVYWGDHPFSEDASLYRSPIDVAAEELLATVPTVYFPMLSGDNVYYLESLSTSMYRVPKAGGTPQLAFFVQSARGFNPYMFGTDTHIFWVTATGVSRAGYDGSNTASVVEVDVEYRMKVDANVLYVVSWDNLLKVTL
jgi:hypothetical protein